jgi:formiminotetrahydrofolate cyclodeaminase
LNPCDYFLWGFLKDRAYLENIGNVSLLKERIKQYCAEISEEICKNVYNLRFRLNNCIIKDGKHFSDVMKKSRIPFNIVNPNNSQ